MRLIDATELAKKWFGEAWVLEQKSVEYCDTRWEDVYLQFFDDLDSMPTVDAEPVRHGHWISIDNDGDSPYKCSVCGGVKVNENGEWLDICQQEWSKMPYCSVCGAKMDERKT